jgi:hypothetical protein
VHQPAQGALDQPPAGQDLEAPRAGGTSDDFEVDAVAGGVVDEVFAVAAVGPAFSGGRGSGRRGGKEAFTGDGVLDAGGVTSTVSIRPVVSMMMLRLRPTIRLPTSAPCSRAGTLVEVFTLWASITKPVGSALRPSSSRTRRHKRALRCSKMPSFSHRPK